jgi:hypothetical protein
MSGLLSGCIYPLAERLFQPCRHTFMKRSLGKFPCLALFERVPRLAL